MCISSKENEELITQEYLKSILEYNTETGDFTRLVTVSPNAQMGVIAGSLDGYGYIIIGINKISYKAHRLAWLYVTGKWPKFEIDHIEGINIPNFNKFSNLRDIKQMKNILNTQKIREDNTSGIRGISFYKTTGRYVAQIQVNNKKIHLGYFFTAEEASDAYERAKLFYHKIEEI